MEKYYSVKQLQEILSLTESAIRKMIADGRLESVKFGRSRRIPESAVKKKLIKENEREVN